MTATHVGFAGGHTTAPSYQEVCTKKTGHAEVVKVDYDPAILPLEELLQFFFSLHDPTIDRRGRGGQYRSAIYFSGTNEQETALAQEMIAYLHQREIMALTEVETGIPFYPAAGRHQQYCDARAINPRSPKGIGTADWAEFSPKSRNR